MCAIGYTNYRLEVVSGIAFEGIGACFGDRLRVVDNLPPTKLMKNVETRWCDTTVNNRKA